MEPRTVTQFHFTSWPDHGVPTYATSLLNFIKRIRIHHDRLTTPSPMVVHCRYAACHCNKYCIFIIGVVSAGVGRTGTFIVVDYSFQKLKQEKEIDIFHLIKELRAQRPFMVQTPVSVDISQSYMVIAYFIR